MVSQATLSNRKLIPLGLEGGDDGAMGVNTWVKRPATGTGPVRKINLGGKATVKLGAGDRLVINTPGGGGWGPRSKRVQASSIRRRLSFAARGSLAERTAAEQAFGA